MRMNSMYGKFNNPQLSRTLLFVGAITSIAWAVYFSIVTISMPYQIELREGTALVLTRILLNRENPFTFENQPLAMTNYGIGYNLATIPFAAVFGNTLLVHRAVVFAFILLSAWICIVPVYKKHKDVSFALTCGTFVIIGLVANGGIGAFPSAMGTCLFLLAVLIPFNRSFDMLGLLASILFSLLAFYTKPYFVLSFGVVTAYLFLFVSKRKTLIYSVAFLPPLLLSLFVMRLVFPLYFINTIVGNVSNTYQSFGHLQLQLKQLFIYFYPTLFLALFMIGRGVLGEQTRLSMASGVEKSFDVSGWDRPLFGRSINYYFYSFICSFLAFVFILGTHIGNYMNYAYQLMVPLFFCWFFQSIEPNRKFRTTIVLLVLFNLLTWEYNVLNPSMLKQGNSKEWAKLYDYVGASSNILNAPLVTSELVALGKIPVDAGQTLVYYNVKPYPDFYLIGPPYSDWQVDGYRYTRLLDSSIEKQNFDLVITTEEKATFFHSKHLPEYYSVIAELVIDMPQTGQSWTVLLWKPSVE